MKKRLRLYEAQVKPAEGCDWNKFADEEAIETFNLEVSEIGSDNWNKFADEEAIETF